MFLVYIAAFSASLFGVLLAGRAAASMPVPHAPRRGLAGFLFACGVVTSAVWLLPLVSSGIAGEPPKLLDTYTVTVTDVLDLGVIVPTVFIAAALVLRRSRLGYVLATAVIVLLVLTAATIVAGTVLQLRAGLEFTPGEVVGPISGFLVLGAVGMALLVRLLRSVPRASPEHVTAPAASESPGP